MKKQKRSLPIPPLRKAATDEDILHWTTTHSVGTKHWRRCGPTCGYSVGQCFAPTPQIVMTTLALSTSSCSGYCAVLRKWL